MLARDPQRHDRSRRRAGSGRSGSAREPAPASQVHHDAVPRRAPRSRWAAHRRRTTLPRRTRPTGRSLTRGAQVRSTSNASASIRGARERQLRRSRSPSASSGRSSAPASTLSAPGPASSSSPSPQPISSSAPPPAAQHVPAAVGDQAVPVVVADQDVVAAPAAEALDVLADVVALTRCPVVRAVADAEPERLAAAIGSPRRGRGRRSGRPRPRRRSGSRRHRLASSSSSPSPPFSGVALGAAHEPCRRRPRRTGRCRRAPPRAGRRRSPPVRPVTGADHVVALARRAVVGDAVQPDRHGVGVVRVRDARRERAGGVHAVRAGAARDGEDRVRHADVVVTRARPRSRRPPCCARAGRRRRRAARPRRRTRRGRSARRREPRGSGRRAARRCPRSRSRAGTRATVITFALPRARRSRRCPRVSVSPELPSQPQK